MRKALVIIALLVALCTVGAGVHATSASATSPPAVCGTGCDGTGSFPLCNAAHSAWYYNPGFGQWWQCRWNPYLGWIWVPV